MQRGIQRLVTDHEFMSKVDPVFAPEPDSLAGLVNAVGALRNDTDPWSSANLNNSAAGRSDTWDRATCSPAPMTFPKIALRSQSGRLVRSRPLWSRIPAVRVRRRPGFFGCASVLSYGARPTH